MHRRKPSLTSLIAFFLIVSPLVYLLSYAPVVRFCENRDADPDPDIPYPAGVVWNSPEMSVADSSRYTPYRAVDWLIDNTPLRTPLFLWADVWGVRNAFENGSILRKPLPELPPFGTPGSRPSAEHR